MTLHESPAVGDVLPEASRFRGVLEAMCVAMSDTAGEVRFRREPGRAPRFGELDPALSGPLEGALARRGIARLYTHQVEAIDAIRSGRDTVVVTRTASGKSLCYQAPVIESLLDDLEATTLCLYPTKALAQDQLRSFRALLDEVEGLGDAVLAGTYDGDTSGHTRRKLRDRGQVLLSNPDMLHRGILPYHGRWVRFLERLRYVVIDEAHTYRGIFGSHVAQVLRRLQRVLDHYGVRPTYVLSSATIGNPGTLAARLIGREVHAVTDDGAPAGPRTFVFWNPPPKDETRLERRSTSGEAERWLSALVQHGFPTLVFTRTRVAAELVHRYACETLSRVGKGLSDRLSPYRSGYLPRERREIERRLFEGELLGVVATNALELGIDVGGLDAVVLAGFPSTVASTYQRAGRAGRAGEESLVVVIAYNEPIDQYLVRRPEEILQKGPEHAVVDLDNPYILAAQLGCAAAELPLDERDRAHFGAGADEVAEALVEDEQLRKLEGAYYWSGDEFPAGRVSLRNISDDTYTIMDVTRDQEVIGNVDEASALELLYPEAIYLHGGRTYYVRELDLEQKLAFVEPREVDYYTQAIVDDRIRIDSVDSEATVGSERVRFGEVDVHWATVAFKKIQFHHLDAIGFHALDLPYQELHTQALWYAPGLDVAGALKREGLSVREAMSGLRNVVEHLAPRLVMCDRADLGSSIEASNTGASTLFIYDRYPGGLGFAEKVFELWPRVLASGLALVEACPCPNGCPSCVGVPPTDAAPHDDPEVIPRPGIPGKRATTALLGYLVRLTR